MNYFSIFLSALSLCKKAGWGWNSHKIFQIDFLSGGTSNNSIKELNNNTTKKAKVRKVDDWNKYDWNLK